MLNSTNQARLDQLNDLVSEGYLSSVAIGAEPNRVRLPVIFLVKHRNAEGLIDFDRTLTGPEVDLLLRGINIGRHTINKETA